MGRPGGRIRVYYEAVVRDLELGSKKAEHSIDSVGDAARRQNVELDGTGVAIERVSDRQAHLSNNTRTLTRDNDSLTRSLQATNARFTGMRNLISVFKWPAFIAGTGYAAEGLGSMTAGAVGLTSALAPLSGALVAYPSLLGSFAQALGVGALALGGVKGALSEMNAVQTKSGQTATKTGKEHKAAAEQVESAERSLRQANHESEVAQNSLTAARHKAVAELKELKDAAVNAGFSEKRAAEDLKTAREELRKAETHPGEVTGQELTSLQLQVQEARQALKEARDEKNHAEKAVARSAKNGIEGNSNVASARSAASQARQGVVEATRELAKAQESESEAMESSGSAAETLASKLAAMPARARQFTRFLFGLKPKLLELQTTAADGLLPGLEHGIGSALTLFPRVNKAVGVTASVLSKAAEKAGDLVGSKGFGKDFTTVASGNAKVIGRIADAGLHLGDSLRHIMVAAQPFLMWLSGAAVGVSKLIDEQAKAGRETGRLGGFFDRTREVIERLASTGQSLAAGFLQIGHAAAPLGRQILGSLDEAAQGFEDWTKTVGGENALRDYFEEAKPGIFEMGRLIKDVGKSFFEISQGQGFYTLTHELRTQLLPVITELVKSTTTSLGPHLVSALVQIGKLFGNLGGSNGPLVGFVDAVTHLLTATNFLIENVPGMKTIAVTLAGIAAVSKATKFLGMVTGLRESLGLAKKLAVWMGIIDAAETGAGGAGAAAGAEGAAAGIGGTLAGSRLAGMFGKKKAVTGFSQQALEEAGLVDGASAGGAAGATGLSGLLLPVTMFIGGAVLNKALRKKLEDATSGSPTGDVLSKILSLEKYVNPVAMAGDTLGEVEGLFGGGGDDDSKPARKKHPGVNKALDGINLLRSGVVTRMKDIFQVSQQNMAAIEGVWGKGTGSWRRETAKNLGSVVAAIKAGMREGVISTHAGHEEIRHILNERLLITGSDPLKIAEGFEKSWKETGQVNESEIGKIKRQFAEMPKSARESAQDAMLAMAHQMESKGELVKGSASKLQSALVTTFGRTNRSLVKGLGKAAQSMAGIFGDLKEAVGSAFGGIAGEINTALSALGVKKLVDFSSKIGGAAGKAIGNLGEDLGEDLGFGHAGGGTVRIPGQGLHDTVPLTTASIAAMVAPGEDLVVLNRHQRPMVDRAVANQYGVNGLDGFFSAFNRPHYAAKGGQLTEPRITGPEPLRAAGQHSVDRVFKAAAKYLSTHSGGVQAVIANGDRMDHLHQPYLWGGGHGSTASWGGPWDCSGGISELLNGAKGNRWNFAPMVSGGFQSWGLPGKGDISVLANPEHVYGVVKDPKRGWRAIGTSESNPGGGFGWIDDYTFRPGFTIRHADLGGHRGGYGKRGKGQGQKKGFSRGGQVDWGSLVGSSWDVDELATLAHVAGMPNAGLMGAIAYAESTGDPNAENHNDDGSTDFGLWQDNSVNGAGPAQLDPWANALMAKAILDSQGVGAWVTFNEGLIGAKGHVDSSLAAKIRAALHGESVKGGGHKAAHHVKKFPAGHTGAGGGTYGSKAGAVTHPPKYVPTIVGPLKPGQLPSGGAALPTFIQHLLGQPGLTTGEQLSIGELASQFAGETTQPIYDAEGNEISSDSHADDIAAAQFQKPFLQRQKTSLQKKIGEIDHTLKTKKLPAEKQKKLLNRQARLRGQLGEVVTNLHGLNQTIGTEPESGSYEAPTASDYADRDLALAELAGDPSAIEAAKKKQLQIAEETLAAAEKTADPRDDIEAAQNVKALREAVEANTAAQQQREEFEKERLELDKQLVGLAEAQGPAFMAAWVAWVDGAIGGSTERRSALPATPGVAAGYSE